MGRKGDGINWSEVELFPGLKFKSRLKSNILVLSVKISTCHHTCGKESNSFKIIELENVFSMIFGECLTGGFLCAVPHESFVPLQAEQHAEVIVWGRLWSPLVNILFGTKLLSLVPLSWDMDCLILWLSLPLVPLVMVAVCLVFWSLSFPKEVSCTAAYIYS